LSMKEKEKAVSQQDLDNLLEVVNQRFQTVEDTIRQLSSSSSGEESLKSSGGADTPIYKCKGRGCTFATDDLDAYIDHKVKENQPKPAPAEEPLEAEAAKVRHKNVDDFLDCPECRPRFDKRYVKDGWTPPKKEPEKKPEKGGGLGI